MQPVSLIVPKDLIRSAHEFTQRGDLKDRPALHTVLAEYSDDHLRLVATNTHVLGIFDLDSGQNIGRLKRSADDPKEPKKKEEVALEVHVLCTTDPGKVMIPVWELKPLMGYGHRADPIVFQWDGEKLTARVRNLMMELTVMKKPPFPDYWKAIKTLEFTHVDGVCLNPSLLYSCARINEYLRLDTPRMEMLFLKGGIAHADNHDFTLSPMKVRLTGCSFFEAYVMPMCPENYHPW